MKSVNYYGNAIKNHMESMKRYEILAKEGEVSMYASWKNKKYGMSVLMPILSRSYKTNRHLITYEIL